MAGRSTRRRACRSFFLVACTYLLLPGCTTTRNTLFQEVDAAAERGEYETAVGLIDENEEILYSDRDGVLYFLDRGMLLHYANSHDESIRALHEAERLIEEYFTLRISQAATSLLLNDTALNYAGEDFEDIYLNVFNALSFLELGDSNAAFVEVRRLNDKLNLLEVKYRSLADGLASADDFDAPKPAPSESRFFNSALARYISMVIYRAEGNRDSARISFEQLEDAFREQANLYPFPNPISSDNVSPDGGVPLSVVAFSGRAPVKRASTLRIRTETNRVFVLFSSEDDFGNIPQNFLTFEFPVEDGYHFRFELPRMHLRGSQATNIQVFADGRPLGEPRLIEDIERIAVDTFEVSQPIVFVRSAVRTLLKGIAGQRAGRAMQEAGVASGTTLGWLAGAVGSIATDIAVDQSEQADLRISRYFPAYAHVGEWVLPPGSYEVHVEYSGPHGVLWVDDLGVVEVRPGSPNLVSSFFNG